MWRKRRCHVHMKAVTYIQDVMLIRSDKYEIEKVKRKMEYPECNAENGYFILTIFK